MERSQRLRIYILPGFHSAALHLGVGDIDEVCGVRLDLHVRALGQRGTTHTDDVSLRQHQILHHLRQHKHTMLSAFVGEPIC